MDIPWWWDLTGFAGIISSIGVIVVGRWAHQSKTQVKNKHSTNLRDDLDVIRDEVRSVGRQVGEIRKEIDRTARRQMQDDQRHTAEIMDVRAGSARLAADIADLRFWQENNGVQL